MTTAPLYYAASTAGLERVVWGEIARRCPSAHLVAIGHRVLTFAYGGDPHDLLALRAADDVFAAAGAISGLDRTRLALRAIRQGAADLDLLAAAERCRPLRSVPERPRFAITASFVGTRNYTRYEIADALGEKVAASTGWVYLPNTPAEHAPHDLHLRVMVEGDTALVGVRLAEYPLHRRPFKLASRPGALRSTVAHAMALLAGAAPGAVALDPCCGVGSLALEAATLCAPAPALASDLSYEAVLAARENSADVLPAPLILQANAAALPLPAGCVAVLLSNLPFGRQVGLGGGASYRSILQECCRVLRPGCRAALLTEDGPDLMAAARAAGALRLVAAYPISLGGLHPTIYVFEREGVGG